jgi:hypothetical protein
MNWLWGEDRFHFSRFEFRGFMLHVQLAVLTATTANRPDYATDTKYERSSYQAECLNPKRNK